MANALINAVEVLRNQLVGSVEQEIEEIDYTDALENLNKRLESWTEAPTEVECVIAEEELDEDINSAAAFREHVEKTRRNLIKA